MRCDECRFWDWRDGLEVRWDWGTMVRPRERNECAARCRRYAPSPTSDEEWEWPLTNGNDWCGDFILADEQTLKVLAETRKEAGCED